MNEIGETLADSSPAPANIRDMTLDEVEQMITTAGERPYRARQILHWLYARGADSFDQMRDLPSTLRQYLKQNFTIGIEASSFVSRSSDRTRNILIRLP